MNKRKGQEDEKMLNALSGRLLLMSMMAVYDLFCFSKEDLLKFNLKVEELKLLWFAGKIHTDELLRYCNNKDIQVYKFIKDVPQNIKMKILEKKLVDPNMYKIVESVMLVDLLIIVKVLIENYSLDKEQIDTFIEKIGFYIDSYTRHEKGTNHCYMNDDTIRGIFKEELEINLICQNKNMWR